MSSNQFTVIGGGLAGSLMAIYLGRRGQTVKVYERRPDPRLAGAEAGRSINLAISTRGLYALEQVGLRDKVLAMAVPMRGRMIHDTSGKLTFQPYGTRDQAINSVSRGGLNQLLLDAAEETAGPVIFQHRLEEMELDTARLTFSSPAGPVQVDGGTVVGADGAFSAVRTQLQRRERFNYSQEYLAHGYKELYIPPASAGGFRMEPNALHIWPRGGFMMIALPNFDGSFTCTLFWAFQGANSFENLKTEADVLKFFTATYPDAVPLMPTLAHDFFANPTSSLVTVRCSPWHYEDRIVLVGDAAHALVPFYGQGANAAFEDCVVLDQCLDAHASDRARAFADFEQQRKRHADAIADLALANFIEMRDRVASPMFLLKKKIEKILHGLFPQSFIPLYTMVSFSRIPYADAVDRARRQDRVLRGIGLLLLLLVAAVLIAAARK
jgi:kynurenine 3-monooxygenase